MSAFGAIQELIWIKGVLSEIGIQLVDPITLRMDAKSARNSVSEEPYPSQTQQTYRYQIPLVEGAHVRERHRQLGTL